MAREGEETTEAQGAIQRAKVAPSQPTATPPREPPATLPGAPVTRLGRYEVLFEIARGGMGAVYAGCVRGPSGFHQTVALKVLHRGIDQVEERAALVREARLSARIHHKNVVQTLELGEEGSELFVAMQLVRGVPLSKLVAHLSKQDKRLSPELAGWIAAQAAEGLHAAHELADEEGRPLGLVHRDISPHNILLGFDGSVFVADFGIAKVDDSDHSTETGIVKGKFGYMSPEQARGQKLDRRSDIFSLGVVLYESVTGERLFAGQNPAETILNVLNEDPPSLDEVEPTASTKLAVVVAKCLAKRREDRFETAAELEHALADCFSGASAGARDLQSLLRAELGSERAAFESRLERALGAGSSSSALIRNADMPTVADRPASAGAEPEGTRTDANTALPIRREGLPGWAFGAVALLAGAALGIAYFLWTSNGNHPLPTAAVTSTSAEAKLASVGVATTAAPQPSLAPTTTPAAPVAQSSAPSAAITPSRGRLPVVAASAPPRGSTAAPAPESPHPPDTPPSSGPGIFQ